MFNFIVKNIPTTFLSLNNNEVDAENLRNLLEQFNDDDINDYDLFDAHIAIILVEMNILKKCAGERMAILYRKTDEFNEFYNKFMEEYFDFIG